MNTPLIIEREHYTLNTFIAGADYRPDTVAIQITLPPGHSLLQLRGAQKRQFMRDMRTINYFALPLPVKQRIKKRRHKKRFLFKWVKLAISAYALTAVEKEEKNNV